MSDEDHPDPPDEFLVTLTGKQRDFLASYPNEVEVYIVEYDLKGVLLWADSNLPDVNRWLWVPAEGFISQPTVELHDWEVDLDQIPESNKEDDR